MVQMSFDWKKLRKELDEDLEKIIKSYGMFSKEYLEQQFISKLEETKK